jgi:hypothetical protein
MAVSPGAHTESGLEGSIEGRWLERALDSSDRVSIMQLQPTVRCIMTTH